MSGPSVGALFAGYGGLEIALHDVFGAEPAWFSEFDKAPSRILAHHWPDVPNLGDITAVDWSQVEPVDIITGGSPCQDLSHAGKRAGMKAGTRSGLWASMCDAIDILRPSLVIWENVRGAYSAEASSAVEPCPICVGDRPGVTLRALGRVLGDLAELGYDAAWTGLRAADVGAPHGRFRVFVLAWPAADTDRNEHGPLARSGAEADRLAGPGSGGQGAGRDGHGLSGRGGAADVTWGSPEWRDLTLLPSPRTSDTNGAGAHGDGGMDLRTAVSLLPTPAVNDMGRAYTPETWDAWTERMKAAHGNGNGHGASLSIEALRLLPTPRTENNENRQSEGYGGKDGNFHGLITGESDWGQYAPAIARWEALTRPAPAPTEPTGKGGAHRLSPAFVEWLMGLPEGHVTDVPGITRNDAIKALGNGVVPQQAAAAIRHLLDVRAAYGDMTKAVA